MPADLGFKVSGLIYLQIGVENKKNRLVQWVRNIPIGRASIHADRQSE